MFASKDTLLTRPSGGYSIARSVRLRSSASAYFNRTLTTPTNNKIWTYSFWIKRGKLGVTQRLFFATGTDNLFFSADDVLNFYIASAGSGEFHTTQVFRDPSAWYHIVIAVDTTQATSTNRVKIYVNGVQVTSFSGTTLYPTQNYNTYINSAVSHAISGYGVPVTQDWLDGYLTEINFVDGQALTPSSFGSTNAITGVWQPAKYTGTYGTNGFYLNFSDNSNNTSTTIGKDYSFSVGANLRSTGTNIGGMTANGGLAGAFDGTVNAKAASAVNSAATSGYVNANAVGKDWGVGVTKTILAFRAYSPTDAAFRGDAVAVGFKLQGSTDNFSTSVVDLYTGTTPSGTAASLAINSGIDTSTAYRYHRFVLNGNGTNDVSVGELELYEAGTSGWNNWTPNNISVTAGTTYDSMTDVPTLTSATAANYAVWNPLDASSATTSNANLTLGYTTYTAWKRATIGVTSGKWYWEITPTSRASSNQYQIGIALSTADATNDPGIATGVYMYYSFNGNKWSNGSSSAYGASYDTNDVIGVAFDADAGTLVFYKNNTSQGTAFTGLTSGPYFPMAGYDAAGTWTQAANFGQRPFSYTPPTGFVALNTYNLPASTIKNGAAYMAATTYTGTNASLTISNAVNGVSMQPDLVWVKARSQVDQNVLCDSVRGVTNRLFSNLTNAEASNGLVSINSSGFVLGDSSTSQSMNNSGQTYIGWQWKAGTTSASNTNGSITSTVSAGATQGFSVVTYTGTGAVATVGHGLGVAPRMIIVKRRDAVAQWDVYHASIGATGRLYLNATDATNTSTAPWNDTTPTSTVFTVGTASDTNASGSTIVAYCFSAVAGYSAFGSYTANASSDGPFIYTGFRPRWVMIKSSTNSTYWYVYDSARNTYNLTTQILYPNLSSAEATGVNSVLDFLSNGFKIRDSGAGELNISGATFIYACFAENPLKYALAR